MHEFVGRIKQSEGTLYMSKRSCNAAGSAVSAFCEWRGLNVVTIMMEEGRVKCHLLDRKDDKIVL